MIVMNLTCWAINYELFIGEGLSNRQGKDMLVSKHSDVKDAEHQYTEYLKQTIPSWQSVVSVHATDPKPSKSQTEYCLA